MPDPTPTPTPAPKTTPKRGDINQDWLDEFTNSEAIAAVAQKTAYAAPLANGGIDAAKPVGLSDAILAARQLAGLAVQDTSGKRKITGNESDLQKELIRQIQTVQKRARQKYDATEPVRLKDYAVGQQFYNSRSLLEQTATNILLKLNGTAQTPADALPGIDAGKIAALQQALTDYQGVQTNQTGAQSDATTARRQVEAAVAEIVARRREIQFAADAEWTHTDPANAGIRKEFQLPPDRVMK